MTHEISNRAFEKMTRLYFMIKGMSVPTVYEEDGFYETCACCQCNVNKHAENCEYEELQKQAEKLAFIFEPYRRTGKKK